MNVLRLSLDGRQLLFMLVMAGNASFLLLMELNTAMHLEIISMVYYHVVLLPLVGWSSEYLFRIVRVLFSRVDESTKESSFSEKSGHHHKDYLPITKIARYARWWAIGFIDLIFLGILLGFVLNMLTRTFLLASLLLFFFLVIVILGIMSKRALVPFGSGHEKTMEESFQWRFLSSTITFLLLLLAITVLMLLPRIPILLEVGGVFGLDTWYASALASRIVHAGKIDFLSGILGFLEVYPTEKVVVAPLSLALISLFSGTDVLAVQFFHVLWMTVMSFCIFAGFLDNFLSEMLRNARWSQLVGVPHARKLGILSGLYYFYVIPTVLAYTDGFLSGRTIFFVFFPLFLVLTWELVQHYHDTGVLMREQVGELFIVAIFLTISHRMALVVMMPLLLLLFLWIYWKERNSSVSPDASLASRPKKRRRRTFTLFERNLAFFPLMAFVGANVILGIQVLQLIFANENAENVQFWFNRFYTYRYLPRWFIDIISSNRLLDGIVGGFLGISLASGGIVPLFIVMLVITWAHRDKFQPRSQQDLTLKFNNLLILSSIPALVLLYQGAYFYQVILPVMFVGVVTWFVPLLESMLRRFARVQFIALQFQRMHFRRYLPVVALIMVVFLGNIGLITEQIRVNASLNLPEGDKRHVSDELRQLASKLASLVTDTENITVLVSRGTIAVKLSVLVPWVRFIPNHRSLYGAYGFVSYGGYRLKEFPTEFTFIRLFSWIKYPFDATPLYTFERTLQDVLASNATSVETRQVLLSWNVKYAIVEKLQDSPGVPSDQKRFFSTLEEILDPLFETRSFMVFDLSPLLTTTM